MACLHDPVTKVGSQRIEIVIEPVAGKDRQTASGQALADLMDKLLRILVFALSDVDDRHNLGLRFESDPDPHPLTHAPHLGHQLVQLQVLAHQVHKEVRMQSLGMLPRALQPAGNRPLVMAEDTRGR